MEKFVISDEDFLNEVKVLVDKMWDKYSNLHKFMEKDDVVSETMITWYGTDRNGIRRIDKYAEQGEKYFKNTLRYLVEKEFQGFYWRNEHRKEEASLDWRVGDDEDCELVDLIPDDEDCFERVYINELIDLVPNESKKNYYILSKGQKISLTDKVLVEYILKGYSLSEVCDIVYSERTGKLVTAQTLYSMYSALKENMKKLVAENKRKQIMESRMTEKLVIA